MDPLFLSLDEVLEMHQQQIDRYGGSPGIRDSEGCKSALATPQPTFDGEYLHTSIPAMAAAYLFHICQNHPFVDGNKRVGANAANTFLLMNDDDAVFAKVGEMLDGRRTRRPGAFVYGPIWPLKGKITCGTAAGR